MDRWSIIEAVISTEFRIAFDHTSGWLADLAFIGLLCGGLRPDHRTNVEFARTFGGAPKLVSASHSSLSPQHSSIRSHFAT